MPISIRFPLLRRAACAVHGIAACLLAACDPSAPAPAPPAREADLSVSLPSLQAMLQGYGVRPMPQLGDQLEPGTLLAEQGGSTYIVSQVDLAYANPAALRGATQRSQVLEAVDCEDRFSISASGEVEALALVGLGKLNVQTTGEAIQSMRTRLTGLERVEVSLASLHQAQLKPEYQPGVASDAILQAQVVWRVKSLEISFHAKAKAGTSIEVRATGAGGSVAGSAESSTQRTLSYANKVIGCYPALRLVFSSAPEEQLSNEDRQKLVDDLRHAGLEAALSAEGITVAGAKERLPLARSLFERTRDNQRARSSEQRLQRELDTTRMELDRVSKTIARPDISQLLETGTQHLPDRVEVRRILKLKNQ
ncbi:MAG: hypothetical protein IPN34_15570 [Planctomycetes bacterium]|nr:hypothetical protein [Planctomycetota bacterium]